MIIQPKSTLVPARYFDEKEPRCFLSEVAPIEDEDVVEYVGIPQYDSVLVYVKDSEGDPEMVRVLSTLPKCKEYDKIVASHKDGVLYLAIARGDELAFCNYFVAQDFITAEYFIFNAVKSLQLNPEVLNIAFLGDISADDEMSLYRYFKSVEII